jgi:hypothetical protein
MPIKENPQSTSTHGEEDVVGQEVSRQPLDLLGEGGGEHERLALTRAGHVLLLNNPAQPQHIHDSCNMLRMVTGFAGIAKTGLSLFRMMTTRCLPAVLATVAFHGMLMQATNVP